MSNNFPSPLGGPVPDDVLLLEPPLIRVIAQVQFAPIYKIGEPTSISNFQESIRKVYPFITQGMQIDMTQGLGGPMGNIVQQVVWRFESLDRKSAASLSSTTLTLDSQVYAGHAEFLGRWSFLLEEFDKSFENSLVTRIGMRYINQFKISSETDTAKIISQKYLNPFLGEFPQNVSHSVSETALKVEEGDMLLRLMRLPANATFDPVAVPPSKELSIVLDIDVSLTNQVPFSLPLANKQFEGFAGRARTFFQLVVASEFIESKRAN